MVNSFLSVDELQGLRETERADDLHECIGRLSYPQDTTQDTTLDYSTLMLIIKSKSINALVFNTVYRMYLLKIRQERVQKLNFLKSPMAFSRMIETSPMVFSEMII